VRVFRLKREAILPALENRALRLLAERPEVLEVRLFGSLIKGNAGPGSDADILIVLSESAKPFLDRIPDYARFLTGIGVGCDIFPYTRAELASLLDEQSHFAAGALRESRVLAVRPPRTSGAGAR
jgi:predicted nucleotidyltransferase